MSEYDNLMQKIDGIDIPFSNDWDSLAVSVSGGADSALLAYLLCTLVTKPNFEFHIISHIRCWKTKPWQSHDSLNVFVYLTKHFPHIKFKRHVNFIAPELEYANIGPTLTDEYGKMVSGDNIEQRSYAEYICHHFNIAAYFNAVTHNPKNVDFQGMPSRDIEPTDDNKHLEIMEHMNVLASHPFRFVDKSWVIKQYKRLNLIDLFKLTRSCEGTFEKITYRNYISGQSVPLCGECFWCKERSWAIKANEQVQEKPQ